MTIPCSQAWVVGHSTDPDQTPRQWVPARIPGAVQLDWARAHDWPSHVMGEEVLRYRWMEDVWWFYRLILPVPTLRLGERCELRLRGIDYTADLFLDGRLHATHTGMYSVLAVDLSHKAGSEVLVELRFHPVPKSRPAPDDRVQANEAFKAPVSYSWDFHPRLVPLGLCEVPELEILPPFGFQDVLPGYVLSDDLAELRLRLAVTLSGAPEAAKLRWTLSLLEPGATPLVLGEFPVSGSSVQLETRVRQPRLWWPHGHGEQALYREGLELLDLQGRVLDQWERRVGYRRARLVMHPGQWGKPGPAEFPKPRAEPPFTLEINGRRLFAKGANWVAPDIFYGALEAANYEPLLRLARDSNFNLLRCWGGAPVMKDSFFELADELGLMIWQEFTLACNKYPDDEAYLAVVDRESQAILRRLHSHPCIVLWCGGNELFNSWSGMDDQALVLRLLDRNCFNLDPQTPFIPTSPVGGVAHGHYSFRDMAQQREVWAMFQESSFNAYTEYGVPGIANQSVLQESIPEAALWPPVPGGIWSLRHAFGSWTSEHHLCLDVIRHYFGEPKDLSELVSLSQWLQAEGLRGVYEEARRQQPRCSMALAWCFNEPWPTAANLSLVCWPARPKPALAAVREACRPILVSARIPKFQWTSGERFHAELWLLNDTTALLQNVSVSVSLCFADSRLSLLQWTALPVAKAGNEQGPSLSCVLPDSKEREFILLVEVADHPEWSSRYRLSLKPRETAERQATARLNV